MIIVKKHVANNKLVVAACDKDLLGKKIENADLILDLKSDYYNGKETGIDVLKETLRMASAASLIGKDCVSAAEGIDLIKKGQAKNINGIPYLHVVFA